MALYVVHHWQFIEERFAPATEPMSLDEAWAYVRAQVAGDGSRFSGKDISRFRVVEVL